MITEQARALVTQIQQETKVLMTKKQQKAARESAQANNEKNLAPRSVDYTLKETGAADHLFLDDKLEPVDITWLQLPEAKVWRIVRSFVEFEQYLEDHGLPKFISFDYDLGNTLNGFDCAMSLNHYCKKHKLPKPDWSVHSVTISGQQAVSNVLFNNI